MRTNLPVGLALALLSGGRSGLVDKVIVVLPVHLLVRVGTVVVVSGHFGRLSTKLMTDAIPRSP